MPWSTLVTCSRQALHLVIQITSLLCIAMACRVFASTHTPLLVGATTQWWQQCNQDLRQNKMLWASANICKPFACQAAGQAPFEAMYHHNLKAWLFAHNADTIHNMMHKTIHTCCCMILCPNSSNSSPTMLRTVCNTSMSPIRPAAVACSLKAADSNGCCCCCTGGGSCAGGNAAAIICGKRRTGSIDFMTSLRTEDCRAHKYVADDTAG